MKNTRRTIMIALALVVAITIGLMLIARNWSPPRTDYAQQGIDVSHENGAIQWPTVAADGVDFAYLRASEGADFHDTAFASHWAETKQAGLRRGAYHRFSLCQPAREQATNFIAHVPRDADALPAAVWLALDESCTARPAVDVVLQEVKAFLSLGEGYTGKPLLLYVTADFEAIYPVSERLDRPLWLRSIATPPAYATRPWVMWQATAHRRVRGIDGPVNWNVVRG